MKCKEHLEKTCKSFPNCYGCNNVIGATKFDQIKSMTLEEMAKEFAKVFFNNSIMEKVIVGYLESEVQEE